MEGFEWCELADGRPVLTWCVGAQTGHAFLQKGDGSVSVQHTALLRSKGSKTFVVDPQNNVKVPDEMLAWAKSIMGGEHRMTLGFASGMTNSGVGPDCFLHTSTPDVESTPIAKKRSSSGPIKLGSGSWSI